MCSRYGDWVENEVCEVAVVWNKPRGTLCVTLRHEEWYWVTKWHSCAFITFAFGGRSPKDLNTFAEFCVTSDDSVLIWNEQKNRVCWSMKNPCCCVGFVGDVMRVFLTSLFPAMLARQKQTGRNRRNSHVENEVQSDSFWIWIFKKPSTSKRKNWFGFPGVKKKRKQNCIGK